MLALGCDHGKPRPRCYHPFHVTLPSAFHSLRLWATVIVRFPSLSSVRGPGLLSLWKHCLHSKKKNTQLSLQVAVGARVEGLLGSSADSSAAPGRASASSPPGPCRWWPLRDSVYKSLMK